MDQNPYSIFLQIYSLILPQKFLFRKTYNFPAARAKISFAKCPYLEHNTYIAKYTDPSVERQKTAAKLRNRKRLRNRETENDYEIEKQKTAARVRNSKPIMRLRK